MYTSYIGKKFLKLYNEREGKNLTAEEFFNDYFFELFFRDGSHLMHIGNSPFFQKPKKEDVEKFGSTSLAQLHNLQTAIKEDVPNMSIYVGSAAKDLQGTTSGQVTSIDFPTDAEEMYASWIGEALSVGVTGRYGILFMENDLLWIIYKGWNSYRKFLSQSPNIKDKEISFWNALWLSAYVQGNINLNKPLVTFNIETETSHNETRLKKLNWSEIIFSISKMYPNKKVLLYAYQLDKTNITLGFINTFLPEVRKMYEFRDALFLNNNETVLTDKEIETLSTFYNFRSACQLGTIGLKTLEPAKLREYMPSGSKPDAKGKEFKFTDEESYHNYQLYKIWITAMLNKTELLSLASQLGNTLLNVEEESKRGKSESSNIAQSVLESKSLKSFIESLNSIISRSPNEADNLKKIVEEALKMPSDNFPLFITLTSFEYNYQKTKN